MNNMNCDDFKNNPSKFRSTETHKQLLKQADFRLIMFFFLQLKK